jgi:DNA polymerase-3 subunit alpha
MIDFCCHVHKHSEFSPLDGAGNANQYSWQAVRNGQTHMGLTDHGRLGGVLEHFHACRHPEAYDDPFEPDKKRSSDERITPILGLEAYFRRNRHMETEHTWAHHLCLHAASLNGWRTLMRLSSKSWVRRENGGGFYGKPCIDFEMLDSDHEDIIVSTACLGSPLAWFVMQGDDVGAKRFLRKMRKVSKNGVVWLEIMPHDMDEQREYNLAIVNLAAETGDPLIATGDVHIPFASWERTHEVLRLASYKQTFTHRESKRDAGEEIYTEAIDTVFLSSGEEMFAQFQEYHPDLDESIVLEAMANTHEFTKQFNWYVVGKSTKAPEVDVDADEVVNEWVSEGWGNLLAKYPEEHWEDWPQDVYAERIDYEYGVLRDKGVLPYFYIVGDFVRWAKSTKGLPALDRHGKVRTDAHGNAIYEGTKRPIRVGLGRGSAAGSLVSYLIGITAIDPIPHKLLFERFLNPDRVGYPDIDMDFETELTVITTEDGRSLDGRECIKEYLKRVYGHDHVVDIIAYQTFAPRVAIRDVCAVYEIGYQHVGMITESIGDTERGLERIANGIPDKDIEPNYLVANLRKDHPDIWEVLLNIEDQILRDTRHAGGVVITPKPTTHYMPTQLGADEETLVTAWADRADFPIMADYGFLKYDILGVRSLSKHQVAMEYVERYYDEQFEPNELPALRDPKAVDQAVIDIFVNGLMWEVFQFGGRGITQLLRHIKPDNATDISVANALYRPGPIKIAFEYGDRKNGKVPVTYWHDALEPILGETLGLMCFQEQMMEVVKVLGNFTGGQADAMRKAVSKLYRLPGDKAQQFMAQFKEQWMAGCYANGLREEDGENIWTIRMLPLGNYLFNRSHSSSYGLQAYQDGWFKVHYPLAFYAAALTLGNRKQMKKDERREWLKSGLREARIFDIEGVPPDVNRSDIGWAIDQGRLRYGLVSVSEIGSGLAQDVLSHRPYEDFSDFINKVGSGFGADKIAALAKAGAFDELEDRKYLLSQTRQWDEGVAKVKVKMDCGHLKTKTIKGDPTEIDAMVRDWVDDECFCKHHEDAVPLEVKRLDDTYEVARFLKEHPNSEPFVISEPDDIDIAKMELDALNVPLVIGHIHARYRPFIDARIYPEAEVLAMPEKPEREGKLHGWHCGCKLCEAAFCIVGGEVVRIKTIRTKKKQELMCFVDFSYGINSYSVTFFPFLYNKFIDLLSRPTLFLVSGHRARANTVTATDLVDVVEVAEAVGWEPEKVIDISKGRQIKMRKKKRKGNRAGKAGIAR